MNTFAVILLNLFLPCVFLLFISLVPYIYLYIKLSTLCHFDHSKYTVLIYYGFTVFLELILYDVVGVFFVYTHIFLINIFFTIFLGGVGGIEVELVAVI